MKHTYFLNSSQMAGLVLSLWLLATTAWAQAPAWSAVVAGAPAAGTNTSITNAMATDAAGNVVVVGSFTGKLTLGSFVLTSAGLSDLFIAKYLPATATWAWAQRGGGTDNDYGQDIAVSGPSVYVTGSITTNLANANATTLQSSSPTQAPVLVPQPGSTSTVSSDILVAKYLDSGSSATLTWAQVGGGTGYDEGYGIAVSGPNVYVTGSLVNNLANAQAVVFGGMGSTVGTAPQYGSSTFSLQDIVLVKYLDAGASATLGWTQVGGGKDVDYGLDLAVSGANIYVAGYIGNDRANSKLVVFGGAGSTPGTTPQYGACPYSSNDLLVAKYTDNGMSATLGWTQVGGGIGSDQYWGIAVNGPNVYLTGNLDNDNVNNGMVLLGGSGTVAGTVLQYGSMLYSDRDLLVAKYVDNGSSATLAWTQAAGGSGPDVGYDIVVRGTSVYITGFIYGSSSGSAGITFGAAGTAPGTYTQVGASTANSADVVAAKYTDNGSTATVNWVQVAGGIRDDYGQSLALSGTSLYVGGLLVPAATFGGLSLTTPANAATGFLATLNGAVLANNPAGPVATPRLYPNPAPGPATLSGATPNTIVLIIDALGRRVATATADASGAAALPAGLVPGLYLVRAGAGTVRWVVE
ncbi:MAG: hypothetical protein ACRYFZ_13660 [Janthinobacterium lividum]